MAIFIFDFGTTLAAALLLPLEVLPPDELPLLQAATPRMAIAASAARYLQPWRLTAVLLRRRILISLPLLLAHSC
jgi:hypothetical protein